MQSTLTSKGQVTIPKAIREALGLLPGDRLEFVVRGGKLLLVPLRPARRLKGMLPTPEKPVTLEEMEAAIAARGGDDDRA